MRSLRILHVTPYSPEAWAYGGIPRLARTLTRELSRRGHQVTICTTDACDACARLPTSDGIGPRFHAWPPRRTDDAVELRVFPNVSNRLAYRLQLFLPLGLHAYLRRHASAFDVAHLHACRNLPGAIAAYHLRRAGVPYVLAPNGTALRLERRLVAKRAFDLLIGENVLQGAARVLAVSHAEERQLRSIGVGAEAVRLIPNPVDLREFAAPLPDGSFRRRYSLPDRAAAPLVLFLGKLTPRKGVNTLVRAFADVNHRDARLVVAGNDMGAGTGARALARSLGVDARTTFTGLLSGGQRLEALADADVVVYPSTDEIFGLVPLEALLCGTPVIVSDDSGCGEVIASVVNGHGGGLLVPPNDASALSLAIGRVLAAPRLWREAAMTAAASVRASYGEDTVTAQLERLYAELVERN